MHNPNCTRRWGSVLHSSNVAARNVAQAKPSSGDQAQKKARRSLRDVLVPIPLAFLGLGVYRAG